MKPPPWIANGALLLGGILAGAALAEGILRWRNVVYAYLAPHPDPALRYILKPNLRGNVLGHTLSHNSRGLRDREYPDRPAPGVTRILFMGDSITYSRLDPQERTFPKLVEASLNARGDGRRYEALHGGASGYTSCQEEAYYRNVGAPYHPDVVVWQYCLNDVQDPEDPFARTGGLVPLPRSWKEGLREHLRLWNFLRMNSRGIFQRMGVIRKDTPPAEYARYVLSLYGEGERLRRDEAWECIRRGRNAMERDGADVIFVVFPFGMQVVGDPSFPDAPQEEIAGRCRDAGIRCLDLLPAFRKAGGWDLYQRPDFIHPSEKGHRVAAAAINEALQSLLPVADS